MTIKEFLKKLSSKSPTPGGGSCAALAGAMSAGLVSMIAGISGDEKIAVKSERFMNVLTDLIEKDAQSYKNVLQTYCLPEGDGRDKKIEAALKQAAEIPLQTAKYSYEVLKLAEALAKKVKPGVVSDVGVAALLAGASIKSALLNVDINLKEIKDEGFKKDIEKATYKIAGYFLKAEDVSRFVQKKIVNS